jgi:hypothetical protein
VTQAIIADQLTYVYEKVKAVDYISFQVAEGEIFKFIWSQRYWKDNHRDNADRAAET